MPEVRSEPRRGRPPKIGLETVLEAASRLAREQGSRELTMRGIARALDVDASALYGYVESKEALLRALSERACEQLTLPEATDGRWDVACLEACESLRDQLRRHPDFGLFHGNWEALAPFNARATGLIVSILSRAPLPEPQILAASQALLYLITSLARLESELADAAVHRAREYNDQVREALPNELSPAWAAFVDRPAAEVFDTVFTTGVRGLLAGLAATSPDAL